MADSRFGISRKSKSPRFKTQLTEISLNIFDGTGKISTLDYTLDLIQKPHLRTKTWTLEVEEKFRNILLMENRLELGEMVGPYKIVRKISAGGMGEVYEAFEKTLQRRLAIKILSPEASISAELVKRFEAEGRALARLEHGHVVRVYALGEHHGQLYIAMEYVDGWTLDEYLRTHYFGFHEFLRLARHMLEGLAAAHGADVFHRDIKPQNVMVDRQLNAKLLDFGIAKLNEDNDGVNTVSGVMFGTLNYVAPEIFNGGRASEQSDLYSLGLVLYLMLTGKSPFVGKTRLEVVEKVANNKVTFSPETETILPPDLKKIILKMTAKDLHERYSRARDVLDDLRKVDLGILPQELRPALSSSMNIECPDELRGKCAKLGLEFLETRLVICLAAEIMLKSQGWTGQDDIKISEQAMSESVRRYTFAKKQMLVKKAYTNPNFKLAVGGLVGALTLAAGVLASSFFSWNGKGSNTSNVPLPIPETAIGLEPIAPTSVPVVAPPMPVEAVAQPEPAKEVVKETPKPSHPVVTAQPKPVPAAPAKIVKAKAPIQKKKIAKKVTPPRVPATISPAAPKAAPLKPSPAAEPDFLQQKPVLLPTVIERRKRR